tara:strand:+ start:29191 stop:33345 length:4155 start_codon:yes stop_codon:yes gene_type:complete
LAATKYKTYDAARTAVHTLGFVSYREYQAGYQQDSKLPSKPHKFYEDEWVDWYDFLGNKRPEGKYPTYEEARTAARALGFKVLSKYKAGYQQDSKLPSSPDSFYGDEWVDWYDYLGPDRLARTYPTYEEARAAARAFGFEGHKEFQAGYQQDSKLPSSPHKIYEDEWVDWYDFLGKRRPDGKYPTYEEARTATRAFGFGVIHEYQAGYHQDAKLPSSPDSFYGDEWVDWHDYLGTDRRVGKYGTYDEARTATCALGFTAIKNYKAGYQQDSKLPSSPNIFYADNWVDWYEYFGTERPVGKYATYDEARTAARAFGFGSFNEYKAGYMQDAMLPSSPDASYKRNWVDWYDFLGNVRQESKYLEYEEACSAAQAFGFAGIKEYRVGFTQDPKLPSSPDISYKDKWVDWYDFLGNPRPVVKYRTYEEARLVVQALGISGLKQYQSGYTKDPMLPSQPQDFYKEKWVDWYDFLGNERPEYEKYATYEEARLAAQTLGFDSSKQYFVGYMQDPRLHSNPHVSYADDWEGWYDFLGNERLEVKYLTYEEARSAAKSLNFDGIREYKVGYKQDPKLPSSPHVSYADEWVDWYDFLGNERSYKKVLIENYPQISQTVKKYVDVGVNQVSKLSHLKIFIRDVIETTSLADQPGALVSKDIPFPQKEYIEFINSTGETQKRSRHNICVNFLDWVIDEYCSDEDDEGLLTPLPGYRNPLKTILKGLLDQLPISRPSESVKPVLQIKLILRCQTHLIPSEAKTFGDLYQLHSFFDDCWVQVDPELIDASDPNCIYREVEIYRKGKVTQIWSPVKLIALYCLISMPLRGQQILWLDSGEGDEHIPIWEDNKVQWVRNTNKLANTKRQQGFIKKYSDGTCGSYITTNKTGRKVGGYSIPWMAASLDYWIIQLRDWQSKYNPLTKLTPWTQIKLRQKTNKKVLQARGKQAFLFRDPASMACKDKVSPMFTTTAFTRTLPALLFNIQQSNEDLAQLVEGSNTQYKSQFSPHSLRVSLITAYIVDGGAPIHVISKLVGHASLVMTIYYTKVGHLKMKQAIGDAEKKAAEQNIDRMQDLILQKRLDEAKPELIATDRSILDGLGSDWPSAAYQVTSLGICPMGGAGCNEGGELLVERTTEITYAPVAAGYLGARNCPRCRFFITGPAFFGGLAAIANEVILEMKVLRVEYHELEQQMQDLEDERYDLESSGQPFKNGNKLKKVTASYEEKAKKLDVLLCDFQHLYRFISQSIELLNTSDSDKNQLIVSDQYVEMGMQLSEQESEFRLLAEVCSNAEIYTSSSASRALPLLAQILDKLADTNGIAPSMFRLTEKQQLKAANQIVSLIMKSAQNDWHVADRLINGAIMLEDLGQDSQLMQLHKEIESIMHGSLTLPIIRENCDG